VATSAPAATLHAGTTRPAASAPAEDAVGLSDVRFGGDAQTTRVVLDLDGAIPTRTAPDEAVAGRLTISLPPMLSTGPLEGRGQGLVRSWSLADTGRGARLVLQVAPGATVARRFLIPPAAEGGAWRYVIDLKSADAAGQGADLAPRFAVATQTIATARTSAPTTAPTSGTLYLGGAATTVRTAGPAAIQSGDGSSGSPSRSATPRRAPSSIDQWLAADTTADQAPADDTAARPAATRPPATTARAPVRYATGRGLKVIVIDPGHGGHDTGARSLVRNEKDLNLAAALALRDRLLREGRYRVVMTRDSDVFIPLEQRVQIARKAGADLFISLHSDSAGSDPTPHGASVYTISDHGETRVNTVLGPHEWFASVGGGVTGAGVRQILLDLTQNSTRNRSSQFAGLLLQHIGDKVDLLPRSHRDANYFVLLAPDVPAVLLEMGFITNPADEMRLTVPEQRSAMMNGVADAIDAYFFGSPRLSAG
jgi:N-acetylmuramoyl-L-alanine amidase